MARRPEYFPRPMSVAELKEYEKRCAMLAPSLLEKQFHEALCKANHETLPAPRTMQELVAMWRQLWRSRRR
jgi:hypothetical protein